MMNLIVRFLREEKGEDLIEYGLLAAFVATVATATVIADPLGLRTAVVNAYKRCVDALNKA
ncbi:MAG: Flp family type IVb pilin [Candidatus Rokuibacteriota bacterium]|nr:MAG: Flp family type IVb pilin [Candidatus Rokubacteria bacterium]